MDALVKPLEQAVEGTEFFVRTPSLRLLYIQTGGALRMPLLQHTTATEMLDCNDSPFFVLEAPTEPGDDGWSLRTEELHLDWQGLRDSAPEGTAVPDLWPASSPSDGSAHGGEPGPRGLPPLASFAADLAKALSALPPPIGGIMVVLAPVWLRDGARFCADLKQLLRWQGLGKARFIIVETDTTHVAPLVQEMADTATTIDARIDDAVVKREMDARLEAMKNAPAGASGFQLVGAAGPPVPPPPRKGAPPPLSVEQRAQMAAAAGIAPALLDPIVMNRLRVLVLSASAAMRDGKTIEAIRLQREARDHCLQHGLTRETVVNDLVLGGFVLQAGHPDKAREVFHEGKQRAEAANLFDMAVQAQMALAGCLVVSKRFDEAAEAYAEAGRLGAERGSLILAIEGFRTSGQIHVSRGRLDAGTLAFRRALATAESGTEEIKRSSSAKDAARELAALCRKHGLIEQAKSLEAQAASLDSPDNPTAPPPAAV